MSTLKVNTINAATSGQAVAGDVSNPRSFRNLIINGAMQVAQRGTSTASISSGTTHVLDRWGLEVTSGGSAAVTMSQSSTAPAGFSKSLKIAVTTADASLDAGERWQVRQRIEGQDLGHLLYGTADAKKVTFSFWVRSNLTGTFAVGLYQDDGGKVNSGNYTISSADTWEKKTITINGNTSDAMNIDNTLGFQIGIGLGAGTNYTAGSATGNWSSTGNTQFPSQTNVLASTSNELYFTGVQLEVGSYATDFEHRSYGDELARCERYYKMFPSTNFDGYTPIANGYCSSTSRLQCCLTFNPMRAIPTVTFTGNFRILHGDESHTVNSHDTANDGNNTVLLRMNDSGGSLNKRSGGVLTQNNDLTAKVMLSAEL